MTRLLIKAQKLTPILTMMITPTQPNLLSVRTWLQLHTIKEKNIKCKQSATSRAGFLLLMKRPIFCRLKPILKEGCQN